MAESVSVLSFKSNNKNAFFFIRNKIAVFGIYLHMPQDGMA